MFIIANRKMRLSHLWWYPGALAGEISDRAARHSFWAFVCTARYPWL